MTKNLLIVESPAKAKTIEKILGTDYIVKSCYGHIRDLPKDDSAIDIDNNFTPKYIVPEDKKKVVKELEKLVKSCEHVWLATDEDREGEAIAWHLCEVFGLDVATTKRIVFHEITKPAIQKAVESPRIVNKSVVDAQQARRILDRLVGFELSPILWRKVSRSHSLSAGRVQSVAVRVIAEREKEITAFEVKNYYKVVALYNVKNDLGKMVTLKAELPKRFDTEVAAKEFLTKCIAATFSISDIQVKPAKKKPAPPFTTSTLQQDAARKFGYSVIKTMAVAQKLYEAGKITYMRTDSVNLSDTAIAAAASEIDDRYGDKYVQTRKYTTKSKDAQEAHEAIRPSYFNEKEAGSTDDEQRLYALIWKRAIASQMSDAELEKTTAKIDISSTSEVLVAKGEVLKFDGFLKVYRESIEENEQEEEDGMLPPLTVGQILDLDKMSATERFNRPPARYTEASLVKRMEELGIGRPSTYAPTISTIQKRKYVERKSTDGKKREYKVLTLSNNEVSEKVDTENTGAEKQKLFPTDMGMLVNDFLVEHFGNILNYGFTAKIEEEFDQIAKGNAEWNTMLNEFYHPFHDNVETTLETAKKVTGARELGIEEKTGKKIIARLGKYGPMIQIGEVDEEEKPRFAKLRPNMSLSTVTLEEALELFKLPRILGTFEDEEVKVNEGRFGPYILHNKKFTSLGEEDDLLTVNLERATQLILEKREADAKKTIKTFEEDPDVQVLIGRWGPYIKAGKKNVKIPKDKEPADLTYEEVAELVANAPEKKKRYRKK